MEWVSSLKDLNTSADDLIAEFSGNATSHAERTTKIHMASPGLDSGTIAANEALGCLKSQR